MTNLGYLNINNLSKSWQGKSIIDHFSMRVEKGSLTAIVGKSGCGKTTLLRMIAGVEKPDCGEIWIDNVEVTNSVSPNQRNIAMVFQEATLWNYMTVLENITYGMKKKDLKVVQHIAEALEIDSLLGRYPDCISGGQAKRVALARAFAAGKELLLLDEPLSNIDQGTKASVLDFILREYYGKKTILYVTHDESELEVLGCEKRYYLD